MRHLFLIVLAAAAVSHMTVPVLAGSTGWVAAKDFQRVTFTHIEKGEGWPLRIGARVKDGKAEFNAVLGDLDFNSAAFEVFTSRKDAEALIEAHRDPGPGVYEKLCIANIARAREGDTEYWAVHLVNPDHPRFRCRKMPAD